MSSGPSSSDSTGSRSVLFFGREPALGLEAELATRRLQARIERAPTVAPSPDPRGWQRAVSELALFNWLLLPTSTAAEALIEAIGAPPGPTLRIAAVGGAGEVLRAEGRAPEIEAPGLRAALELMASGLGRRQRALVPHAAVGGHRIGDWLEALGAEVVCRAAYGLEVAADSPGTSNAGISDAVAAVLADAAEAESLACHIGENRVPAALPIAALDQGAADAAEDCGLTTSLVTAAGFGPFLDEALS